MLIPAFLLLLLLMLQPVCLLYTRSVMESTAAETARLLATGDADGDEAYRSFALRRLAAIPDLSIFMRAVRSHGTSSSRGRRPRKARSMW